jgi:hypothetical protein
MSEPIKICIQRAETRQEWDAMQDDYINRAIAAAARIEELEKYQSIHAQCDKVSLELEAKLVKQLGAAHKRIEKLEDELHHCFHRINELQAALRRLIDYGMVSPQDLERAQKALEGKND